MRPTDSSLRVPPWLVGLAALALALAVVTANLDLDLPSWRFPTLVSRFVQPASRNGLPVMDDQMNWLPQDPSLLQPNGRPYFLAFTDRESPAARRLAREVFQDRWCARRISGPMNSLRVILPGPAGGPATPRAEELVARYGVRKLPTIVFLDPLGNVVERVEGYPGRSRLMHAVTRWEDRYPMQGRYGD